MFCEHRFREQRGQEVAVDERSPIVDEEAPVGVPVPGDPEIRTQPDDLAHDELAVLGQQRVRLVVGEMPVGLPVRLDEIKSQIPQRWPDHGPGHPVAAVDDHSHGPHRRRIDELERGLLELLVQLHVLDRAAARCAVESGFELGPDLADPGVARQRNRAVPDQLRAGVALGVVRGRAHQAAVEPPRTDQVIEHLGPDLAGVDHGGALGAHPLAVRARHLRRGQAHVAPEPEPQRGGRLALDLGDHARERPPDQLSRSGVDVGPVKPADVVGLEDVGVRVGAHRAGCYPRKLGE